MEPWTAAKKVVCLGGSTINSSGFLANGQMPPVPYQSRLTGNENGDNKMKLGAVHRYLGI